MCYYVVVPRVRAISVARVSIDLPPGVLGSALQKLYKHANRLNLHSFPFPLLGSENDPPDNKVL